jgi:hypothetical protein
MPPLDDEKLRRLLVEINATFARYVPGWTEQDASDPGITVVRLFAFLTENLIYRMDRLPPDRYQALLRAVERLLNAKPHSCASFSGLMRLRFFEGRLLTAEDFQQEQDYFREKSRQANRCLVGIGIVSGLKVTVDPDSATTDAPEIVVEPGCAIDPKGERLTVWAPLCCKLKALPPVGYVVLRYTEREVAPTTALQTEVLDEAGMKMGRVEEGVAVAFEHEVTGFDLALARLERQGGVWRVDVGFHRLTASHLGDSTR